MSEKELKQFPKNFYWGEMGMGPHRKAGEALLRGGVAQIFGRKLCVTSNCNANI